MSSFVERILNLFIHICMLSDPKMDVVGVDRWGTENELKSTMKKDSQINFHQNSLFSPTMTIQNYLTLKVYTHNLLNWHYTQIFHHHIYKFVYMIFIFNIHPIHWPFFFGYPRNTKQLQIRLNFHRYQMFDISWSEWKASENDISSLLCVLCLFSQLIGKINIWIEFYVQKNEMEKRIVFYFQKTNRWKKNDDKKKCTMMMMFETETEIMRQSWVGLNSPLHWGILFLIFRIVKNCENSLERMNEMSEKWTKKMRMKSWTIRRVSIVCWVEQSDVKRSEHSQHSPMILSIMKFDFVPRGREWEISTELRKFLCARQIIRTSSHFLSLLWL